MKTALLASTLIISSVLTIGSSAATIGYYNGPPPTPKDSKFYLQVVYLVLAIIGILLGLVWLAVNPMLGGDYRDILLLILALIWTVVTAISTSVAQKVITSSRTTFIINWILVVGAFFLPLLAYFILEEDLPIVKA